MIQQPLLWRLCALFQNNVSLPESFLHLHPSCWQTHFYAVACRFLLLQSLLLYKIQAPKYVREFWLCNPILLSLCALTKYCFFAPVLSTASSIMLHKHFFAAACKLLLPKTFSQLLLYKIQAFVKMFVNWLSNPILYHLCAALQNNVFLCSRALHTFIHHGDKHIFVQLH